MGLISFLKKNFEFNPFDMSRAEAWKKDTEIYADLDEDSGLWCAFGNNSGFAYSNSMDKAEAEKYAAELNQNKKNSEIYS